MKTFTPAEAIEYLSNFGVLEISYNSVMEKYRFSLMFNNPHGRISAEDTSIEHAIYKILRKVEPP